MAATCGTALVILWLLVVPAVWLWRGHYSVGMSVLIALINQCQ